MAEPVFRRDWKELKRYERFDSGNRIFLIKKRYFNV
jgi:hypothetical protein